MATVVIMPGGFHPFHAGHAALYQSARRAFPDAEVFVAATNDTSTRPFPFRIKEKLAQLAGVEPGKFIQVKSPFRANEITDHFDPERDSLIFVRSDKDKTSQPRPGGTKKDGSPAYLQPLLGAKRLEPFDKHAYMAYLPTVEFGPGLKSATEIRTAWPRLNDRRKTALVMSLYPQTQNNPRLAATVVRMLDTAIVDQSSTTMEGVGDYLWHGSKSKHDVLVPRQAVDIGGAEGSNKNAVYATPDAKVAIAMGLTTPGSETGMFPNDPQMVLFKGEIRKGEMVYLHKVPKDLFINHNGREWYSKPDVKQIKPVEIKAVPVDKYLNLIRTATPADLELRKKYTKSATESLSEAVGGNYLYHATDINGLKGILSSGAIRAAVGPQTATGAQTKHPTVSVTRDLNYALGGRGASDTGIGRDVVIVLSRPAIENNFKTLGTSQSQDVRGAAFATKQQTMRYAANANKFPDTNKDGVVSPEEKAAMDPELRMRYLSPKAGGEFEEAVVVPKGTLPVKGTMVGFYVNSGAAKKDPELMNNPLRLDMLAPNKFVKANQDIGENQGWAATFTNEDDLQIAGTPAVGGMTAGYQRRENQPIDEDYIEEKWSERYKRSINCANPRGFSQRAHCAGRKK